MKGVSEMVEKQIVNWVDINNDSGGVQYYELPQDMVGSDGSSIYQSGFNWHFQEINHRHEELLTLTVF